MSEPLCREWVDDGSWRGHPCHRPAKFRVLTDGQGGTRFVCGVHVRHFRQLGLPVEEITPSSNKVLD
jgi:hypothetical protein